MTAIEYLDRPPSGWYVRDVMRIDLSRPYWAALMADVHFDDAPDHARAGRRVRDCWVRIPGKHRDRDAAWEAVEEMMATRH